MHERILAIDYGRARHGLAVSDGLGLAGHPLPAMQRRDLAADRAAFDALVREYDIRRLVVGLPVNMDGTEGEMARETRAFAEELAGSLELPFQMEDERLSTDEAESVLREAGVRPSDRKRLRDSIAAAVILRGVLEREAADSGPSS
ncbi:MAG: Holliday junction resolvase RuvX [Planctomycetota bacterium]|jgi:putative Holliday junction resolvase